MIEGITKMTKKFVAAVLAVTMFVSGTGIHSSSEHFSDEEITTVSAATTEKSPEDALVEQALKYAGYSQSKMVNARGKDYNSAWCCYFVTDMAKLAGLSYAIPYGGGCSSLFTTMTKNKGATVVSTPQKGDLLFYKCTESKDNPYVHIAIVIEVKGNSVKVIHGNFGNQVKVMNSTVFNDCHKHSTTNGKIKCVYVRPAYKKSNTNNNNDTTNKNKKTNNTCIRLCDGMKVQLEAKCNTSCALGATENKNFANVMLVAKSNKSATTWTVHKKGAYWYFVNGKGFLLDCYGTSVKKGNNVQTHKNLCDTSLFTVKYEGDHCYLMFKNTNCCVDCYGYNNWKSGTNVHSWSHNSDISQQFNVVKIG